MIIEINTIKSAIQSSISGLDVRDVDEDNFLELKDESNLIPASVDQLFFPKSTGELSSYFSMHALDTSRMYFIGGGQTGLVGGMVPSLSKVDKACTNEVAPPFRVLISSKKCRTISGYRKEKARLFVDVGSGVTLGELETYLRLEVPEWIFPVDPTEQGASLGGCFATNASGARGFKFGSVRKWIHSAKIVLVDGRILSLTRGHEQVVNSQFHLHGKIYQLPRILKPKTKNTIGFNSESNMDLIDLFIGSEGVLGVCTELTLELIPRPSNSLTIVQFFKDAETALSFIADIRAEDLQQVVSLEFLDENSNRCALDGNFKLKNTVSEQLGQGNSFSVITEAFISSDDEMEEVIHLVEKVAGKYGISLENGVCALDDATIQEVKRYRHAVPEQINTRIAKMKKDFPECRKIATDMAVPDDRLFEVYKLYNEELSKAGVFFSIMGHAGNNHFHVNIVPSNKQQFDFSLAIYKKFAKRIVEMQGAVAAEHGIGRIKKDFLKTQFSKNIITEMILVKRMFDPYLQLNPGVLFDVE